MARLDDDLTQLGELGHEGDATAAAVEQARAGRRFARLLWRDLTPEERYVYRVRGQVPAWAEPDELTSEDADHFRGDPGRASDWPFPGPVPSTRSDASG